jgi:hypothetical protein
MRLILSASQGKMAVISWYDGTWQKWHSGSAALVIGICPGSAAVLPTQGAACCGRYVTNLAGTAVWKLPRAFQGKEETCRFKWIKSSFYLKKVTRYKGSSRKTGVG